MVSIFGSYKKALKVIESCENKKQLVGAKKYSNNFFQTYAKFVGYSKYGFREYVSDGMVSDMYNRLQVKLVEKKNGFKR